jgi:hypothetical protein
MSIFDQYLSSSYFSVSLVVTKKFVFILADFLQSLLAVYQLMPYHYWSAHADVVFPNMDDRLSSFFWSTSFPNIELVRDISELSLRLFVFFCIGSDRGLPFDFGLGWISPFLSGVDGCTTIPRALLVGATETAV